jgi:predicted double-glycine peptidase
MTFLLLALFAISIAVIAIGFFLSYKPQAQHSRAVYSFPRDGRRGIETTPAPIRARRVAEMGRAGTRTRQWTMELAPRRSAASVSLSETLGHLFGGRGREPKPLVVTMVGLVAVFVLGLYALTILLPRSAIIGSIFFYGQVPPASASQNAPANNPQFNATQALIRISQLDPAQYSSTQEYNTWAYSTCSAAAMTEVINAYGHHYRITDILKVESQLGEITPQLGLLEDVGIQRTVAQFGFKTTWGYSLSLDQIIDTANHGRPVIVSFPPSRYPDGHIVVVIGGNGQSVLLADSSIYNRHSIPRTQFMQWWGGFSAIVTPA